MRQAVAHATDVETALMLIYGDLSMPEQCPISRGVFGNDQDFCAQHRAQYDPDAARALLAEAGGWGPDNPLEVNLLVWTGGKRDRLAEVFQAQLAEVGIAANIEIMDIGTMNARVRQENETADGIGSMDMMTWSWYDPDILYALWHSPGAYRGYTSPELDAMLEKTRVLGDPAEREAAVRDVMAYLLDRSIHVPLSRRAGNGSSPSAPRSRASPSRPSSIRSSTTCGSEPPGGPVAGPPFLQRKQEPMAAYLLRRLALGLTTILVATIAVTLLIHLVPGDPVQIMYAQSQGTTPEQLAEIRSRLGLDQPIIVQYVQYLGRLIQGDMGVTIRGQQPVLDLLLVRLPNTLVLAFSAMAVAVAIGLPAGFWAAWRRGTWVDAAVMMTAIAGVSIPHFWLGLMLMFWFSVELGWLPVSGGGAASLILPALTLGLSNAAIVARMTRSGMIDVMDQDFVRTAHAKGLPRRIVLSRHVLRSGLIPVVTMMGLQFTYLMGGAIVVENIFAWNGIGRLAIEAIFQRDYPVIQGFILVFATTVVVVMFLLDLVYAVLDPRIRRSG